MLIKLPLTQIDTYWNLIKAGAVKSDNIPDADVEGYCRQLLIDIYSENATCVLKCNEEREIQAVGIFSIKEDKVNDIKFMLLRNLFGVQQVGMEDWKVDFDQMARFAEVEGCAYIRAESSNSRLWQMMEKVGFVEKARVYTLNLKCS